MFIPLSLNTPLLVGGAVAWFVAHSSKNKEVCDLRRDRGTLISSGLIAGGALFGVFAALTRFFEWNEPMHNFFHSAFALVGIDYTVPFSEGALQIAGLVMYVLLIAYLWWDSCRVKKA